MADVLLLDIYLHPKALATLTVSLKFAIRQHTDWLLASLCLVCITWIRCQAVATPASPAPTTANRTAVENAGSAALQQTLTCRLPGNAICICCNEQRDGYILTAVPRTATQMHC